MLQPIAENLWIADNLQPIMPGVRFPARMLIARRDEGLWIHSPIPLDDALAVEIEALGPVHALVAPNCFHHLHMAAASQRWPEAKVYAPAGLKTKRPDLRIDIELEPGTQPWPEFGPLLRIEGATDMQEFVFLHLPSKTLIVCDLVFNMHSADNGLTRLLLRLVGAWQRLGQSKLWRRIAKDPAAAGASCAAMLELDFQRLYMSHGEVVEGGDVKSQLREGLAWMLDAHAQAQHGRAA